MRINRIGFPYSKDLEKRLNDLYSKIERINNYLDSDEFLQDIVNIILTLPNLTEEIVTAIKELLLKDKTFINDIKELLKKELKNDEEFLNSLAELLIPKLPLLESIEVIKVNESTARIKETLTNGEVVLSNEFELPQGGQGIQGVSITDIKNDKTDAGKIHTYNLSWIDSEGQTHKVETPIEVKDGEDGIGGDVKSSELADIMEKSATFDTNFRLKTDAKLLNQEDNLGEWIDKKVNDSNEITKRLELGSDNQLTYQKDTQFTDPNDLINKAYADDKVEKKQDKLTEGKNIIIDEKNIISATSGEPTQEQVDEAINKIPTRFLDPVDFAITDTSIKINWSKNGDVKSSELADIMEKSATFDTNFRLKTDAKLNNNKTLSELISDQDVITLDSAKTYANELPNTKVYEEIENTLTGAIATNKQNNVVMAQEIAGLQNYKVNAVGGNNPERPLIQLDEKIFIGDDINENIILNKNVIAYKTDIDNVNGSIAANTLDIQKLQNEKAGKTELSNYELKTEHKSDMDNQKEFSYKKFREVDVNGQEYEFTDYDQTYWYQFYVELKVVNDTFMGNLERPAGIPPEITNTMILMGKDAGAFVNILFNGNDKKLYIKEPADTIITKIIIYRKKETS